MANNEDLHQQQSLQSWVTIIWFVESSVHTVSTTNLLPYLSVETFTVVVAYCVSPSCLACNLYATLLSIWFHISITVQLTFVPSDKGGIWTTHVIAQSFPSVCHRLLSSSRPHTVSNFQWSLQIRHQPRNEQC